MAADRVVLGGRLDARWANGDVPFYRLPYIELRGIGSTLREICKGVWRTPQLSEQSISLTAKYTLQKKWLTSRYLFGLPELLTSRPGLSSRLLGLLESLGETDRLGLILLLQGLALVGGVLALLLNFSHPLLILVAGDLLGL